MIDKKLGEKICLCFDEQRLYLSNVNEISYLNLENGDINKLTKLPTKLVHKISKFSSYFRRLLRTDIVSAIKVDHKLYLARKKELFVYNLENKILKDITPHSYTAPLNLTSINSLSGFRSGVYFGEYSSNMDKTEVSIYRVDKDNRLNIVYSFPRNSINHIHNLVVDKYRQSVWILTGDFGSHCGIYEAKNDFKIVTPIKIGKQKYRSCVAFPSDKGLIYATDSQLIKNSIRLLYKKNKNWETKKLYDLNGPSIYGAEKGVDFYFSTSVEPKGIIDNNWSFFRTVRHVFSSRRSPMILSNMSYIVKGNIEKGFKTIISYEKDFLPFFLFQFGNIKFPLGHNKSKTLFYTACSSKSASIKTGRI